MDRGILLELTEVVFAIVLESGTEAELALDGPDVVVLGKRVEIGSPLEPDEVRFEIGAVLEVLKLKLIVDVGIIAVPDPDEVILDMLVGTPEMDEALVVVVVLVGTIVTVLLDTLVVVVEVVVRIVDVRITPLCG